MPTCPKTGNTQGDQAPTGSKPTCIDINQGEMVYKYFNKSLDQATALRFEEHLLLCFYCQDIVFDLDTITDVLAEKKAIIFADAVEATSPVYNPTLGAKVIE